MRTIKLSLGTRISQGTLVGNFHRFFRTRLFDHQCYDGIEGKVHT